MFGADGVVTSAAVASAPACSSVVHADGFVGIWGSNSWAKCTVPSGRATISRVAACNYDTVALRSDGTVAM